MRVWLRKVSQFGIQIHLVHFKMLDARVGIIQPNVSIRFCDETGQITATEYDGEG